MSWSSRSGWLALVVVLLWSATAHAGFYVEGPSVPTRRQARAHADAIDSLGSTAIVRGRREDGTRWFAVRLPAGLELAGARELAVEVAEALDAASLYEESGTTAVRLLQLARVADPPPPAPVDGAIVAGSAEADLFAEGSQAAAQDAPPASRIAIVQDDVSDLLARSAASVGDIAASTERLQAARSVVFVFRREAESGLVVEHTYVRVGDDRFLDVVGRAGDAQSSTSWVLGERAWSRTGDDVAAPADPSRTREVADWFSPESVLPFILGFPSLLRDRSSLARPERVDLLERDGATVAELGYLDGSAGAVRRLTLDLVSGRPLEIELETPDGPRVYTPGAFAGSGALAWPVEVTVGRLIPGGTSIIEVVLVERLDVDGPLDPRWTAAPTP